MKDLYQQTLEKRVLKQINELSILRMTRASYESRMKIAITELGHALDESAPWGDSRALEEHLLNAIDALRSVMCEHKNVIDVGDEDHQDFVCLDHIDLTNKGVEIL